MTKTNGSGIIKTTKKEKQNKREHKKFSKEILSEREFQKNLRKGGTDRQKRKFCLIYNERAVNQTRKIICERKEADGETKTDRAN